MRPHDAADEVRVARPARVGAARDDVGRVRAPPAEPGAAGAVAVADPAAAAVPDRADASEPDGAVAAAAAALARAGQPQAAGAARPRLEMAGFSPRSPAPALVRTADVQVARQLGRPPVRPGWLAQLVDLRVPFG